jgi:hypothetical protein
METTGVPEPPTSARTLYDRMVASGELIPAEDPTGALLLSEPLPGKPGFSAADELEWQRTDRFGAW